MGEMALLSPLQGPAQLGLMETSPGKARNQLQLLLSPETTGIKSNGAEVWCSCTKHGYYSRKCSIALSTIVLSAAAAVLSRGAPVLTVDSWY